MKGSYKSALASASAGAVVAMRTGTPPFAELEQRFKDLTSSHPQETRMDRKEGSCDQVKPYVTRDQTPLRIHHTIRIARATTTAKTSMMRLADESIPWPASAE